jgi:hypothetical protein
MMTYLLTQLEVQKPGKVTAFVFYSIHLLLKSNFVRSRFSNQNPWLGYNVKNVLAKPVYYLHCHQPITVICNFPQRRSVKKENRNLSLCGFLKGTLNEIFLLVMLVHKIIIRQYTLHIGSNMLNWWGILSFYFCK